MDNTTPCSLACSRPRLRWSSRTAAGRSSGRRTPCSRSRTPSSLGVDAVECDVHLSADGEPSSFTTTLLDRTTDARQGRSALDGRGTGTVDAGARFGRDAGFPYRGRASACLGWPMCCADFRMLPVIVEIKGDAAGGRRARAGGDSRGGRRAARHRRRVQSSACIGARAAPGARPRHIGVARRGAVGAAPVVVLLVPPRRTGFALFQIPVRLARAAGAARGASSASLAAPVMPVQAWIVDEPAEMRMLTRVGRDRAHQRSP